MTTTKANAINAAALIGISLWAYFANGMSSETTLIPVAFGLLIAGHLGWMRAGSRAAFAIVAVLTLIVFIALFTPLASAIDKGAPVPILRVAVMTATSGFALLVMARAVFSKLRSRE